MRRAVTGTMQGPMQGPMVQGRLFSCSKPVEWVKEHRTFQVLIL